MTFQGLTAGDANGDGSVDGGDLALMGGSWNKTGQDWGHADFTGEGKVDGGDLALMGGNWKYVAPPRSAPEAPLPEPATLALLGLGGLAVIRRRQRRSVGAGHPATTRERRAGLLVRPARFIFNAWAGQTGVAGRWQADGRLREGRCGASGGTGA